MSERTIWEALDEGRDPTEVTSHEPTPRVGDEAACGGALPSMNAVKKCGGWGEEPTGMSSATVLDSIIEGVRADVAAREAVVALAEIKAAAEAPRRRRWTCWPRFASPASASSPK